MHKLKSGMDSSNRALLDCALEHMSRDIVQQKKNYSDKSIKQDSAVVASLINQAGGLGQGVTKDQIGAFFKLAVEQGPNTVRRLTDATNEALRSLNSSFILECTNTKDVEDIPGEFKRRENDCRLTQHFDMEPGTRNTYAAAEFVVVQSKVVSRTVFQCGGGRFQRRLCRSVRRGCIMAKRGGCRLSSHERHRSRRHKKPRRYFSSAVLFQS